MKRVRDQIWDDVREETDIVYVRDTDIYWSESLIIFKLFSKIRVKLEVHATVNIANDIWFSILRDSQ
jgi:hypothetical protein